MSIVKLPQDYFDLFTVISRPSRTFTSSSTEEIKGAIKLYKRMSDTEKDSRVFNDEPFIETGVEASLERAKIVSSTGSGDISTLLERYVKQVNDLPVDPRHKKYLEVIRFEPSTSFTSNTLRKNVIRNTVIPNYRVQYPDINWGYTNYLCLHFPDTKDNLSASIIYPNPHIGSNPIYSPDRDFTLEFYVKPSYTGVEYSPGTVMHMSSCFAVSVISGSQKDGFGNASTFKILLQLTNSADTSPGFVDLNSLGVGTLQFAFTSSDNLKKNHWHHVSIAWSGVHNDSTGSFKVDGEDAGTFLIPDNLDTFAPSRDGRSAIFIGSYFDGPNNGSFTGDMRGFFSNDAVANEGVTDAFNASGSNPIYPTQFSIKSPFRGELHEIKIWNKRLDSEQLKKSIEFNPSINASTGLLFYVPPFYVKETNKRKVLNSAESYVVRDTQSPFNVYLSLQNGSHEINLENHMREFVRGTYPRLLFLSSSLPNYFTSGSSNDRLYSSKEIKRRNLTILPCDNGKFTPNFIFLLSGSSYASGTSMEKFVTDAGQPNLSLVNLSKMFDLSLLDESFLSVFTTFGVASSTSGVTSPGFSTSPDIDFALYKKALDVSSNSVSFFDISNLYYGSRIYPKSFELIDPFLTGSDKTLRIKLKDNGRGTLYRADSDSKHAEWATSGFLLYSEGIACVTSPYLGEMFGKEDFTVNLKGVQPIHVMETQAIAPSWQLNSSSNPTWSSMRSSNYSNDKQEGFVNITRVNFHDENLNIIMRADLAQPIVKRVNDKLMFRVKVDF